LAVEAGWLIGFLLLAPTDCAKKNATWTEAALIFKSHHFSVAALDQRRHQLRENGCDWMNFIPQWLQFSAPLSRCAPQHSLSPRGSGTNWTKISQEQNLSISFLTPGGQKLHKRAFVHLLFFQ
jgi:hypothetical protein